MLANWQIWADRLPVLGILSCHRSPLSLSPSEAIVHLFLLSPLSIVFHLGTYCCRLQEVWYELLSFFFSFYLWQSLLLFIFYLFTFDKVYCFICLIVAWFPYWSEAFTLSLQSQCSYFLSSSLLRPACPQSLFTCTQMFSDHSVIPFAVETGGIDLGILLARQSWPRAPCHLGLC